MTTAIFTRLAAALAITASIAGAGVIRTSTAASATVTPSRSSDLDSTVPVGVDGIASATTQAVRYSPIGWYGTPVRVLVWPMTWST